MLRMTGDQEEGEEEEIQEDRRCWRRNIER